MRDWYNYGRANSDTFGEYFVTIYNGSEMRTTDNMHEKYDIFLKMCTVKELVDMLLNFLRLVEKEICIYI